jgi:hypothetical protein
MQLKAMMYEHRSDQTASSGDGLTTDPTWSRENVIDERE